MTTLGIVKRNFERANKDAVATLAKLGTSTVHEAMGRTGLAQPVLPPIQPGTRIGGTAITVLLQPGDNWMMHVAAEQIQPGDVVVAACITPNADGFFGDLLATSFRARGAVGLIIDGGVRDVQTLREMEFPVFSRAHCAKGTVKATLGSVNIPIVLAGVLVNAGDAVIADDDGVVVVPADRVAEVAAEATKREANEEAKRLRLAAGELGLDIYDMRGKLAAAGLRYVD